jgi:hypothetical protein
MSLDDRIRRALEDALPSEPAAPVVAERILERFAGSEGFAIDAEGGEVRFGDGEQGSSPGPPSGTEHRDGGSAEGDVVGAGVGGGPHLWFLVVGAAVGIAVGALLAVFTGGGSGGVGGVLPLDAVPIYSCPGNTEIGSLHRGDRILIVGQAGEGWLAVRNVRGSGEIVYVETHHVVPDADTSGLPRRDCEPEGILSIDSTTTTSLPESTTTTVPATTTTVPATTTTSAPATTTTAGDTTAPSISNASANPPEIWEEDIENLVPCPPQTPRESIISAFVTDAVGVTQVTASWTLPGEPQTTVPMGGGPNYTATFGPFEGETLPTTEPRDHDVTVTIRARDAAGNIATTTVVVTVWSVWVCFD